MTLLVRAIIAKIAESGMIVVSMPARDSEAAVSLPFSFVLFCLAHAPHTAHTAHTHCVAHDGDR
jgi:hypothetical protein